MVAGALACVAALVLAGCSGGGGDEAASTTTTSLFPPTVPVPAAERISQGTGACGLLTPADIQAAVGAAADAGAGNRYEQSSSCRWTIRAGQGQEVSVAVGPGSRQSFDAALNRVPSANRLTGVGDAAFAAGNTAYALKGSTLLLLVVNTRSAPDTQSRAATELLRAAVGRL
jgi:hypothetical protein